MKKSLISVVAAGVLVLAACGSDSGGASGTDSGGASGVQAEAGDLAIKALAEQGIELDEGCVDDATSKLSEEDAEKIVASGADGNADLSAEGEAIGAELMGCADNDALVDAFIEQMKGSGQTFDEQCVRDGLEGTNFADLAASSGSGAEPSEDLVKAVFDCFELGS